MTADRESEIERIEVLINEGADVFTYKNEKVHIVDHEDGWDYIWGRNSLNNLESMLDLIDDELSGEN